MCGPFIIFFPIIISCIGIFDKSIVFYTLGQIVRILKMDYQNILVENANHIQTITVNRPKQLNALNAETIGELHQAFIAADANEDIRVIIITGAGDKAFVAGADISEFADFTVEEGELVAIMGSSGSGKSTLLNILGMLDVADSGEYTLDGVPIKNLNETKAAKYRNKFLGFVFQSFNLISYKTALENVA